MWYIFANLAKNKKRKNDLLFVFLIPFLPPVGLFCGHHLSPDVVAVVFALSSTSVFI